MTGRPGSNEATPYAFKYIDYIQSPDVVGVLEAQLEEIPALLTRVDEEGSLHRYAPDKWSFRQVLNHISDSERVFLFRAFWFARDFGSPLPGFDEKVGAAAARADEVSWARHLEEFQNIRRATLSFFRNLPDEAWMKSGTANDNLFTVRAMAYLVAGHTAHHVSILRERYF